MGQPEAPRAPPDSRRTGGKSLFSDTLAQDPNHYAEHYVIEHVVAHVEELFKMPTGAEELSPEKQDRRAQERTQVFAQLQTLTQSMDDSHVMLDLPLEETDSIQDITLHMLEKLAQAGVLRPKQLSNASRSVREVK